MIVATFQQSTILKFAPSAFGSQSPKLHNLDYLSDSVKWMRVPLGLFAVAKTFQCFIEEASVGLTSRGTILLLVDCIVLPATAEEHHGCLRAISCYFCASNLDTDPVMGHY